MSPLVEDYRREAEYAMEMAGKAATEDMRASWLRLAAKWLAMVPGRAQPSTGRFEAGRYPASERPKSSH